jgi:tetratricopeptide (TPR) repeat protein
MKLKLLGIFLLAFWGSCKILISHRSKDHIQNKRALELFLQAQEGSLGYEKAIDLYNQANQIEPYNAIILHERGLAKLNSHIDVEGGFLDLQKSIDYSKDEMEKQVRYCNRGISYMEIGEKKKACEDWTKAGRYGAKYIKKYCNQ